MSVDQGVYYVRLETKKGRKLEGGREGFMIDRFRDLFGIRISKNKIIKVLFKSRIFKFFSNSVEHMILFIIYLFFISIFY